LKNKFENEQKNIFVVKRSFAYDSKLTTTSTTTTTSTSTTTTATTATTLYTISQH
jgi:hypothetical protein